MKHLLTLALAIAMAIGIGCDKGAKDAKVEASSEGGDDTKAGGDDTKKGPYPNWKNYANKEYGFRVRAPNLSPKPLNEDQAAAKLTNRAFQFPLGNDGLGQLMYLSIGGDAEIDIVAGLDGACKQAVVGMNGTMTKYENTKDNGREAREFEFSAVSQGISWKGYGRGIVTGPRTVKAAFAFYGADRPEGKKMAEAFMASFEAD